MVCGSHAKTRAMYSTPPCPSLAASTAAYRRRSFSDSHPKNRCIFCSTSAAYPSMPHSLIQHLLRGKDTTASAIREVILDHILNPMECEKFHIPPDLVVEAISAHRKPPDVRICRLSIQSDVGTRPPSTSTPHCPACMA